jgi:hypothetical protein
MTEEWCPHEVAVEGRYRLTRINIAEFHKRGFVLRFKDEWYPEVKLRTRYISESRIMTEKAWSYLGHMFVLLVLLAIVVYACTAHTEVWYYWRMLLLQSRPVNPGNEQRIGTRTEYSHNTKLLVSFRLRSLVLFNPSPTMPPLPSFLPALSFFFFAVRTLLKRSSILAGNCRAGRWKDRASCFDSRVLY